MRIPNEGDFLRTSLPLIVLSRARYACAHEGWAKADTPKAFPFLNSASSSSPAVYSHSLFREESDARRQDLRAIQACG
jgi:hypothetical protein